MQRKRCRYKVIDYHIGNKSCVSCIIAKCTTVRMFQEILKQ